MKQFLAFVLLLFVSLQVMAQDNTITGTVRDEKDNNPLNGATVAVKGSNAVTATDASGRFSIKANRGAVLEITYTGYLKREVPVSGAGTVAIVLSTDNQNLGEVVVTALGISKSKRTLTYSTQEVSVQELTKARELNIANSLAGKVAGLDITRTSSGVGGSSRVTLRGDRSITGNNQALIVVDGIPIDNSGGGPAQVGGGRDLGDGISSINPDDVENINVLKGASATALYGSRAANGAILITTKRGRARKGIGVSINSSAQVETAMILQDFQNEYGQGNAGVYSTSSEQSWGPKLDGSQKPTWSKDPADAGKTYPFIAHPDTYKDFFDPGITLTNGIALNGGSEKTQAYFSYTNTNAKGIIDNNKLKRHNINFRIGSQFGERLTLDAKITYLNESIDNRLRTGESFDNINRHILRVPRNISLEDLRHYEYTTPGGFLRQNYWNPGSNGGANPYWAKYRNTSVDDRDRITGFASLTYKIIPGLSLMVRSGLDKRIDDAELKWYNDTYIIAQNGNYRLEQRNILETNNDFLLMLDKNLSKNFTINANVGGNIQHNRFINQNTANGSLIIENLFVTGNTSASATNRTLSEYEKQSLYATADIGYKNFLTLTLTGRNDWSSTLPINNNSYFFPSVGLTAILSDMFKFPAFINFAKLRASYAQTGNDAPPYQLNQLYTSVTGGNGVTIGRDERKPIPGLKQELTAAEEIGLDLRFGDNRAGIEFTWYNSNSKNQLLPVTLPAASGYTSQFINAGNVKNSGIEIMLTGTPLKTPNLKWDITVNYARNTNEVIEISPTLTEFLLTQGNDFMNTVKVIKGRPFGELFSRGFSLHSSGARLVDATGMPVITSGQTVYLGNTRPDWTGSILNRFSWRNLSLSLAITARMGGVVSSFTNAVIYADGITQATVANRDGFVFDGVLADGGKNAKTITAEQYWSKVGGRNTPAGEVFTYDASNIRLRELVLGYQLPNNLIRGLPFQSASISLTGRNLFFLLRRADGIDPELNIGTADRSVGVEAFSLPSTRTFGANLNLNF